MSTALHIAAVVLFVIATLIAFGTASLTWSAALVPLGLACWCAASLMPILRPR